MPDRRAPGRGVWLCPAAACLCGVRPRQVARALRVEAIDLSGLLDQVRTRADEAVRREIRSCHRSGLVRAGARAALSAREPVGFVLSADAGAAVALALATRFPEVPRFLLGLDRGEVGRLLGRGPRCVLAILPGSPSERLLRQLRLRLAVG